MNKKLLALALAAALCLSLAACGGSASSSGSSAGSSSGSDASSTSGSEDASTPATETVTLSVAATPVPHAEILEQCVPILAEQGIDLQIHEYNDYVIPNTAVEDGEEDANFFQHVPYLDDFNAERGTHLVSVAGVHVEPMGIYSDTLTSLDELADGASVAVPNDATNEGRALLLLQTLGLITLSEDAGLDATPNDIVDNPKNLTFTELEAQMLPKTVSEVDIAIINSNYAIDAGFNPVEDSLAIEDSESVYVNVLVVKEGNENDPAILALIDALHSDAIRDFINENYGGAVVPAF